MRYSKEQIKSGLKGLEGWKVEAREIWKPFKFQNFVESIFFVSRVAALAEENNHHPDILIKYDTVKLSLTTHDEGGLTERDFNLAKQINKVEEELHGRVHKSRDAR